MIHTIISIASFVVGGLTGLFTGVNRIKRKQQKWKEKRAWFWSHKMTDPETGLIYYPRVTTELNGQVKYFVQKTKEEDDCEYRSFDLSKGIPFDWNQFNNQK